jgi:hypothetical protein
MLVTVSNIQKSDCPDAGLRAYSIPEMEFPIPEIDYQKDVLRE